MKKIAIITWYNSGMNYGQTLQAYALQKFLSLRGYYVETLTYGPDVYSSNFLLNQYRKYKRIRKNKRRRQRKFDKFIYRNMQVSAPLYEKCDVEQYLKKRKFEIIICGSDQIWNPYNIDAVYYLDFQGQYNKIAYAPSLIAKRFSDKFSQYPEVGNWINNLNYVSVRENTGADIVEQIAKLRPEVVLDPTMLLKEEEWGKFVRGRKEKEKYVFCYLFDVTEEQKTFIRTVACEQGCRKILFADIFINDEANIEIIKNMSPEDFLSYIYYADTVVTDSFHGMVFSIVFRRAFYVLDNGKADDSDKYYNIDRMHTLLEKLNLVNRILYENSIINEKIDYDDVSKRLEEYRNKSVDFLIKAIEYRM